MKGDCHYYRYINQNGKSGLISQDSSSKFKGGSKKNNKLWRDSRGNVIGSSSITLRIYDEDPIIAPKVIGIIYKFDL